MAQATAASEQQNHKPSETMAPSNAKNSRGRPAAASSTGKTPTHDVTRTRTTKGHLSESRVTGQPHTPETKASIVLKKLSTTKGATVEAMMEATGWQAHSVRGFLSAVVRKKLGHNLVSEIGKDGVRRYRIQTDGKSG